MVDVKKSLILLAVGKTDFISFAYPIDALERRPTIFGTAAADAQVQWLGLVLSGNNWDKLAAEEFQPGWTNREAAAEMLGQITAGTETARDLSEHGHNLVTILILPSADSTSHAPHFNARLLGSTITNSFNSTEHFNTAWRNMRMAAPMLIRDVDDGFFAKGELTDAMVRARALIDSCVVDGWLETSEGSPLQATVTMAEGRRDFDSRRSIAPEALALLGVVKLSRNRNMISGNAPDLPRDEVGKVLHEPAAAWLAKREAFLPTVWRDLPQEGIEKVRPSFVSPVFVPVARDGSIFHPGQRRDGGYQIGPKDDPENIEDFNTALAALQHADVARWRRPNPKGNWGLVSAVEWRRMERAELEALAE